MGALDLRDPADERLIAATLRCVARWGLAKTTLDDVAREAGCSRATVYRTFPGGKDALFDAVGEAELERTFRGLRAAIDNADHLEDALTAAIVFVARHVEHHAALQFLLAHEPGVVLRHLAFAELDVLLARVRGFGGPLLARFPETAGSTDAGERLAEWVARIVLSYLCSPSAAVRLSDDDSARDLVRTFVLPGLLVPTA